MCQMSQALYSERIAATALPLFPINSLRNQVTKIAKRGGSVCIGNLLRHGRNASE